MNSDPLGALNHMEILSADKSDPLYPSSRKRVSSNTQEYYRAASFLALYRGSLKKILDNLTSLNLIHFSSNSG